MSAVVFRLSPSFSADPALDSPDSAMLAAQQVDAQVVMPGKAQVSLWWRHVPQLAPERLGVIGHFRASPDAGAADAQQVLDAACVHLKECGCTLALGPMDGNTWRSYRFVTWAGTQPRFALEPAQPAAWPGWWQEAGFTACEEYYSALVENLAGEDPRLMGAWDRLQRLGVVIRDIELEAFSQELEHIFAVSEVAFRENVLYTPLPRQDFSGMYQDATAVIKPGLCLLALHDGKPVGFVFAIPDLEQARRGQTVDTLVVKTLAKLPGREYAGLGKILLERCQRSAHAQGFTRAIHALMHQKNPSRNLGGLAREIRRYTLFSKRLG
jgi:hypothetical protein